MRTVFLALVVSTLVVTETSGSKMKLLPAVRASLSLGSSLLRHVAEIKDHLREDIERHLLRHVEHPGGYMHVFKLPNWNPHALRPWTKPSFHGSFSYQASASGGLPILPLPFFPRPRPAIMLVPCRGVRTHVAQFVFPCIKVIRESQVPHAVFGSSQAGQVTEDDVTTNGFTTNGFVPRLLTTTATYGTDSTEEPVTGVVTRAVDVTTTPTTYQTTESTTPAADVTATLDLGTRADDVTTVTESPDAGVTAESSSTVEPTDDRKANMIPAHTDYPTTTTDDVTTEQPPSSTPDTHFNDLLKEAEAAFAKLKEQQ
ncbi:hypothetical protein HPB52_002368 [Rhipicephalus sanguineus]|uniref:Uncharacterized protein n=1 Tax=Rhipicephalus sanguineus TaxID=34632 RepID=A0A9D4Q960_RHISA|nr:hypothetical protein HPB52_002368 [Rhipicephalus sanguineus]